MEEFGAGKREGECDNVTDYFHVFILNVASLADMSNNCFHFYGLYNYEQ